MANETKQDSLFIFTADPAKDCLAANNSAAWRLNLQRAQSAKYLILARNDKSSGDSHGAAFLIAKISAVVPRVDVASGEDGRYAILFEEAAEIDQRDAWKRSQMPVRYVNASELLGRDPETFDFQPVPRKTLKWSYSRRTKSDEPFGVRKLTIAEAKEGLAAQFGCTVSDIEITIRA